MAEKLDEVLKSSCVGCKNPGSGINCVPDCQNYGHFDSFGRPLPKAVVRAKVESYQREQELKTGGPKTMEELLQWMKEGKRDDVIIYAMHNPAVMELLKKMKEVGEKLIGKTGTKLEAPVEKKDEKKEDQLPDFPKLPKHQIQVTIHDSKSSALTAFVPSGINDLIKLYESSLEFAAGFISWEVEFSGAEYKKHISIRVDKKEPETSSTRQGIPTFYTEFFPPGMEILSGGGGESVMLARMRLSKEQKQKVVVQVSDSYDDCVLGVFSTLDYLRGVHAFCQLDHGANKPQKVFDEVVKGLWINDKKIDNVYEFISARV